jgi:nicotinamide phosphoribosyltransferase
MRRNLITMTDSYKASHFLQYPPGFTGMSSYLESRGGAYDRTVFFGLQYILQEYLSKPVTMDDVANARRRFLEHGEPFPEEAWKKVVTDHGGFVPVSIYAVPEGTVVPVNNALMVVDSADQDMPWMVNWIEALLHRIWYPITVATQSFHLKKMILRYLNETSDDPLGQIPFKLHDFGARGVSSHESAGLGGAAHLVSFMGTDTVEALDLLEEYYGCPNAGYSIPAAEHSTITSWGKDNEAKAYENMIDQFAKPGKLVAVVSDSYDIFNAVKNIWGQQLRQKVVDSGATLVIRPDSGDPVTVVNQVAHELAHSFGFTVNNKGFRVLKNVRIIQGDGVNPFTIESILKSLKVAGFSADNVAFGMGGALLQKVDRDTQRFAFKCSAARINGVWQDVYKDPVTDPGKKSKRGRLTLVKNDKGFATVRVDDEVVGVSDALEQVYTCGRLAPPQSLEDIRRRAAEAL